jgi:hypothetical protein
MKEKQVTEDYEDEVTKGRREVQNFEEPKILENGRNRFSEERTRNTRRYEEDDQWDRSHHT